MAFEFQAFAAADFPEYQSWYADHELNQRLGPMDNAWLNDVLTNSAGCTWSVRQSNELVAVIGVVLPDADHPCYCITDFAVKPKLRNQRIGSVVLAQLLQQHELAPHQYWQAYVDQRNPKALAFFTTNGWQVSANTPDETGMWKVTYR